MNRRLALVVSAVALAAAPTLADPAPPTGTRPAPAGKPGVVGVAQPTSATSGKPVDPSLRVQMGPHAEQAGGWWHLPRFTAHLALRPDQLVKMDKALADSESRSQAATDKRRAAIEKVSAALGTGAWDDARKRTAEVGEVAAALAKEQTELKIAVLSVLDAEQRGKLFQDYPQVVDRPWMRAGFPESAAVAPGPGAAPAAKPPAH